MKLHNLHFAHTRLLAKKLTEECIAIQKDEASGRLEWIDYQPFILLTEDDPLIKFFGSPSPIVPTGTQLSMFDLIPAPLPKRRITYDNFDRH